MVRGPTLPAGTRQYYRRCRVSRPGSGWFGVGPRRQTHTIGSRASPQRCTRSPITICIHPRSFSREALIHALRSPARLTTLAAPAASPVVSWGTYLAKPVSVLILGCSSHLDAVSGSCSRPWLRSLQVVPQLLHQRAVHAGPLVLSAAPVNPLNAPRG